jgi:DNA-binding PucR family transcriptional regulator
MDAAAAGAPPTAAAAPDARTSSNASSPTPPMTLTLNRLANAAVVGAIASARAPRATARMHAKTIDDAMQTHAMASQTLETLEAIIARIHGGDIAVQHINYIFGHLTRIVTHANT